jgi:hypothetical protein
VTGAQPLSQEIAPGSDQEIDTSPFAANLPHTGIDEIERIPSAARVRPFKGEHAAEQNEEFLGYGPRS